MQRLFSDRKIYLVVFLSVALVLLSLFCLRSVESEDDGKHEFSRR